MTEYRIPVEETFSWQRPIIDRDLTAPPGGESKGDKYIPAATATGAWAGLENDIVTYDGVSAWLNDTPSEGWMTWAQDEDELLVFNGTAWVTFQSTTGDMLKSVYDTDDDGKIDAAAGGTDIDSSSSTGIPKVTSGVWSIDADLDDLADGATYGRVLLTELNSGTVTRLDDGTYTASAQDTADAITKKHSQNTDTGTTSTTFAIDSGGNNILVKAVSGGLEIKNGGDTAYEDLHVDNIQVDTNITDGTYSVTVAQIKAAYDAMGTWDSGYGAILMDLP